MRMLKFEAAIQGRLKVAIALQLQLLAVATFSTHSASNSQLPLPPTCKRLHTVLFKSMNRGRACCPTGSCIYLAEVERLAEDSNITSLLST